MTLRRILFWLHLAAGVVAGIVILVMAATGVVMAFQRQVLQRAERGDRITVICGQRLPIDELTASVRSARHEDWSAMVVHSDAAAPVEFSFGRDRVLLVNPYSGAVMGEGASRLRRLFSRVEDVHRWLAFSSGKRQAGRAITGACNLAFLVLVMTGPFVWWPREWTWSNLAKIVWFRGSAGVRARFWNWHNVFGLWCVIPLWFIVTTGVIMSYPWANNLLYRATGNEPPVSQPLRQLPSPRKAEEQSKINLDPLFVRAAQQDANWKTVTLRFPLPRRGGVPFVIDSGSGRPDLRSQLILDPQTAEVIGWEQFGGYNLGRRLRTWARFMHTGEAFGLAGQAVAALASAGACFLAFTGISLSWIRLRNWRRRPK